MILSDVVHNLKWIKDYLIRMRESDKYIGIFEDIESIDEAVNYLTVVFPVQIKHLEKSLTRHNIIGILPAKHFWKLKGKRR